MTYLSQEPIYNPFYFYPVRDPETGHLLVDGSLFQSLPLFHLNAAGFDVYKLGTNRLLKINGTMWDRTYDVLTFWSNCFALRKEDTLLTKFLDEQGFYL